MYAQVQADLVTTDFSGFDAAISEACALLQVDRLSSALHLDSSHFRAPVERHVQRRVLWPFAEPHVNVLDVNMAASRTGVEADSWRAVEATARQCPDAGLGCPEPGKLYAQVLTPGYLITLEAGSRRLVYHSGAGPGRLLQG